MSHVSVAGQLSLHWGKPNGSGSYALMPSVAGQLSLHWGRPNGTKLVLTKKESSLT